MRFKSHCCCRWIMLWLGLGLTYHRVAAQDLPNFIAQTIDSSVAIGYGIALGDVDGDGRPDILLADKKQVVWYRNGDWKKFVIAENITEHDNVCIAVADVDGDGKVEVAAGAQWNPSETGDKNRSGSVHFFIRPPDPTQLWRTRNLYHEPTIHRMRWVKSDGNYYLLVLPLHGVNNKDGTGAPVNLLVYKYPELLTESAPVHIINTGMHLTHNFDIAQTNTPGRQHLFIGGKEGLGVIEIPFSPQPVTRPYHLNNSKGTGEVRTGRQDQREDQFISAIEPMHGQYLVFYDSKGLTRHLLDSSLGEGHALAAADVLGWGNDQVIAGWRRPNRDGEIGIKLFFRKPKDKAVWESVWIDKNGMACEDLQVMDMNADGKPDIIASGRQTNNLKIYWNAPGKNR